MIKVTIQGRDVTDLLIDYPPSDFEFPEYPGNIIYTPITELTIGDSLSPTYTLDNSFFKAFNLASFPKYKIEINNRTFASGKVTDAVGQGNSWVLTLADDTDRIINKTQVIAVYPNRTPAAILKNLCIDYGISYDSSSLTLSDQQQRNRGFFYDFSIDINDASTLRNVIDSLCVAGFMQVAVFGGKLYTLPLFNKSNGYQHTVLDSEIYSVPKENNNSWPRYGGGTIKYLDPSLPAIISPFNQGEGLSEFNQDYSQGSLILLNPNGALSLLDLYKNQKSIGRFYAVDIEWNISERLSPGEYFRLDRNILSKEEILVRLVGRKTPSNGRGHFYNCIIEVM